MNAEGGIERKLYVIIGGRQHATVDTKSINVLSMNAFAPIRESNEHEQTRTNTRQSNCILMRTV